MELLEKHLVQRNHLTFEPPVLHGRLLFTLLLKTSFSLLYSSFLLSFAPFLFSFLPYSFLHAFTASLFVSCFKSSTLLSFVFHHYVCLHAKRMFDWIEMYSKYIIWMYWIYVHKIIFSNHDECLHAQGFIQNRSTAVFPLPMYKEGGPFPEQNRPPHLILLLIIILECKAAPPF